MSPNLVKNGDPISHRLEISLDFLRKALLLPGDTEFASIIPDPRDATKLILWIDTAELDPERPVLEPAYSPNGYYPVHAGWKEKTP